MGIYKIDPEIVDHVLGAGTYESYQSLHDWYEEEWEEADENFSRFGTILGKFRTGQLQLDLSLCETIDDDYGTFLEAVTRGESQDVATNTALYSVFECAISVVHASNAILTFSFQSGLYACMVALETSKLIEKTKALKKSLNELVKSLKVAQKEKYESIGQTVVDVAIAAAILYTSTAAPLGLIERGAVAAYQIILDTYVGASTSDAATWGSRANTSVGAYADAFDDYLNLEKETKLITNRAGKVCTLIGFAFDVNELLAGFSNVKEIDKKMQEATKFNEELKKEVVRLESSWSSFAAQARILQHKSQTNLKMNAYSQRLKLQDTMERTGYYPTGEYVARY